jgi:hypothetical protein
MTIVPEFARSLVKELGAPAGRLDAYTEVSFTDEDGNVDRPDGVLHMTRGQKSWTALVEVKTGTNRLERDQVERYVRVATGEGIDAVITISNTFVSPSAPHPIQLPPRVLKGVRLEHWSWTHLLTTASVLRTRRDVSDPEQAWILDELINYLEDDRSGALAFEGLGTHWVAVRDSARAGTLRAGDRGLDEFVNRWDQFLRYLCLHLARDLGSQVDVVVSRDHRRDPAKRTRDLQAALADQRLLNGVLRIPNAAGDLLIGTDLHARRIRASVELAAPSAGYAKTRVNWLLRQLKAAPEAIHVEANFGHGRSTSELLSSARSDPRVLLDRRDPKRPPRRFTVALERDMGMKGGRGRGSFVATVEDLTRDFYQDVVQDLKAWTEPAPRSSRQPEETEVTETPGVAETDRIEARVPDPEGATTDVATEVAGAMLAGPALAPTTEPGPAA